MAGAGGLGREDLVQHQASHGQSRCELGLSSTSSSYSHSQLWVCLCRPSFSAFYGGSSYFGTWTTRSPHAEGVLWRARQVCGWNSPPAPCVMHTSWLRGFRSAPKVGVRGAAELCGHVCGPRGCREDGEPCAALRPGQGGAWPARPHTDAWASETVAPLEQAVRFLQKGELLTGTPAPSRKHSRVSAAASRPSCFQVIRT